MADSVVFQVIRNIIMTGIEKFGRYYSTYRAFVIDNDDTNDHSKPSGVGRLGKILIKVPQVGGANDMGWAFPKGLYAGKNYGIQNLPMIGDCVYVTFEYGDPKFPLWEHGYFAANEYPTDANLQNVHNHWFKTPGGHQVEFDDAQNQIKVTHKNGNFIIITKDNIILQGATTPQQSVLGNNLVLTINQLITAIEAITVMTPAGLSGTPLNQIQFTMISQGLNSILSQINKLS